MKKIYLILVLFVSFASFSQDNFSHIDSIFDSYPKNNAGVSVRLVCDGKTLYGREAGMADISANKFVMPSTVFYLASVSKQFTAACVVLLEQQGKLKLDDKLSKYFPDFPAYASKITLTHLMNHTSGIKDYRVLASIKGDDTFSYHNEDIYKLLVNQVPDFEPGEKHSYSNSGYWILAQIVEKVSGKTIAEFAKENIFEPLVMTSSFYSINPNDIKNSAKGYKEGKDGKPEFCPLDENIIAGGGMFSTAEDLSRWLAEIESHHVFGKPFWDKMLKTDVYRIDKDSQYSKGISTGKYGMFTLISHSGYVDGHRSLIGYFPERNLCFIALSADENISPDVLLRATVNPLLGYKFRRPKLKKAEVVLPKETLEKYTGAYDTEDALLEISINGGRLHVLQTWDNTGYDIPAVSEKLFEIDGVEFLFDDVTEGKAQVMYVSQDGEKSAFKRLEDIYEMIDYSPFAGRFVCKSLGVEYTFTADDKLLYKIGKGDFLPVGTIDLETQTISIKDGQATFHLNEEGFFTGFTLNNERAKNLEFVKI